MFVAEFPFVLPSHDTGFDGRVTFLGTEKAPSYGKKKYSP